MNRLESEKAESTISAQTNIQSCLQAALLMASSAKQKEERKKEVVDTITSTSCSCHCHLSSKKRKKERKMWLIRCSCDISDECIVVIIFFFVSNEDHKRESVTHCSVQYPTPLPGPPRKISCLPVPKMVKNRSSRDRNSWLEKIWVAQ